MSIYEAENPMPRADEDDDLEAGGRSAPTTLGSILEDVNGHGGTKSGEVKSVVFVDKEGRIL